MNNDNTIDNFEETFDEDFFTSNPIYTHFSIDIAPEDKCIFNSCASTKAQLKQMGQIWSDALFKHVYVVSHKAQVESLLQAKKLAFSTVLELNPFTNKTKQQIGADSQMNFLVKEIVDEDKKLSRICEQLQIYEDKLAIKPLENDPHFALRSDGYELYHSIDQKRKQKEALIMKMQGISKAEVVKKTIEDFDDDGFFTLEEALQMPDKVWLIDQILGRHDIGMIYGASGAGKTFITLDLIMSACTGTKFAESFNVKEKLNVAYCAGEGKSGISSRLSAVVKKFKITPSELTNFTLVTWVPQLYLEEEKSVHEFISRWNRKKKNLDLLVIDTFHTATVGAEENSTKDMGKILHSCRLITEKLNCAVLLVHHSEKTGSFERGNGSLRCGNDFVLEVKKGNLICSKLKDGDKWDSIAFQLKKMEQLTNVSVDWLGKAHLPDKNKKTVIETKEDVQEKTILEDKSEGAAIKKVLNLFESKKGQFFTALEIAKFLGSSNNCKFSNKILNQIKDSGLCITSKESPSKPISSSNKTTYGFRDLFH